MLVIGLFAGLLTVSTAPVEAAAVPLASIEAKTAPTYVIHVVIDDLGYHDVQWRNNQTITPTLDRLVAEGVEIPEFYVYKMCAPSRSSILTGRYPMHLGMYNNNGLQEGVDLGFKLLPEVLKEEAGWKSHALGKWHLGWHNTSYLPTSRGFDTFLGSSGNTKDYWNHTIGGPSYHCAGPPIDVKEWYDFINCTAGAGGCGGGPGRSHLPSSDVFGVFDSRVLTARALQLLAAHDTSESLYMYLAYHNVHEPQQAPLDTVERFGTIPDDVRKVTDALLAELDYGVGNISAALGARGMLDRTVFIFHTDNGGPTSHACNYPLRGGKFTFWEGGVRGVAAVSSRLLPAARRGTRFDGIVHMSDWWATVTQGIAGIKPPAANATGPVPPDSINVWDALVSGTPSPRTEVLHLPLPNRYVNTTLDDGGAPCTKGGCSPSLRVGDYKLIMGWPGEDQLCVLNAPLAEPVPYGQDGGTISQGDHCAGGKWNKSKWTSQNATCVPFCLFDVKNDPSEMRDLSNSSAHKHVAGQLMARLTSVSKTGVPVPQLCNKTEYKKEYGAIRCALAEQTGFWLPLDWQPASPTPIPAPTPKPAPTPGPPTPPKPSCGATLKAKCGAKFKSITDCLACTRHCCNKPTCMPKERQEFCRSVTES